MSCLGAVNYDPAVAVTKSCASLIAMTAMDTTNLRITFTAPPSGNVSVRLRGVLHGATTLSQILLGVLDGSTVKGRAVPINGRNAIGSASTHAAVEAMFVVTGLTPGNSYTWDAAYGVEFVVASSDLKYGGPNDTTTNNAFGGFQFEVWDAANLLAGTLYDPATAVSLATTALLAVTALDTTNLRLTFNAPASGRVLVRLRAVTSGGAVSAPALLLGVLDGAAIKGRVIGIGGICDLAGTPAATSHVCTQAEFVVTGLTPGQAYSWDAAYSVDVVATTTNLKYGGPDNTTQDDAWGGFAYEIWAA